ncbi:hypothetical protein Nepgr_003395 [Nepenthes gracilis]|uniref:Uncharacterized protein n=1 Tax=Nepenthes gracilis TaxID=150966 RepID=A0AAD3RZF2_NEPGR|nr:hypothetical protein Nepgr_003395 [Nepenthes gracilis]
MKAAVLIIAIGFVVVLAVLITAIIRMACHHRHHADEAEAGDHADEAEAGDTAEAEADDPADTAPTTPNHHPPPPPPRRFSPPPPPSPPPRRCGPPPPRRCGPPPCCGTPPLE